MVIGSHWAGSLAAFARALGDAGDPGSALESALGELAATLGLTGVRIYRVEPGAGAECLEPLVDSDGPPTAVAGCSLDAVRSMCRGATAGPGPLSMCALGEPGSNNEQVVAMEVDPAFRLKSGCEAVVIVAAAPAERETRELGDKLTQVTKTLRPFTRWLMSESIRTYVGDLDRTIGVVSRALATEGADDSTLLDCLTSVRNAIRADVITVIERITDRLIRVTHLDSVDGRLDEPAVGLLPDVEGLDVGTIVDDRFRSRHVGAPALPPTLFIKGDFAERFPSIVSLSSVASVPAGPNGDVVLTIGRQIASPWAPAAIDALTTLGALIGQVSGRRRVDEKAARREQVDRVIAKWYRQFGLVDQDTSGAAVCAAIDELASAQSVLMLRVSWEESGPNSLPDHEWAVPGVHLSSAQVHESRVRIGDHADPRGELFATWLADDGPPMGLSSLAEVLRETEARLLREHEAATAASITEALATTGNRFVAATGDDFTETMREVLERFSAILGLDALVLLSVDNLHECYRAEAFWRRNEAELPGFATMLAFGEHPTVDLARTSNRLVVSPANDPEPGTPGRLQYPLGTTGQVSHVLVAFQRGTTTWDGTPIDALRRLSGLLSNALGRVNAERYATMAFDHSPVGIAIIEEGGLIRFANRALVDLLGLDWPDQLLGRRVSAYYADPAEDLEWKQVEEVSTVRLRLRRRDGAPWTAWVQRRALVETEPQQWLVHVTDVTARDRAEVELLHAATHDALTGLPNRRALRAAIDEYAGTDHVTALLVLDLDRFKNVNDSMGHASGDDLLKTVASRLRRASRPSDLVVRLGGDEFGVFISGPTDAADAELLADRLLTQLADPVVIDGQRIYPMASLGIALAVDANGDDLMRAADLAMYKAKDNGGSGHVTFDESLRRSIEERHRIETGLRTAVADNRVEVAFQPEFDLETGALLGAEALMRWRQTPTRLCDAAEFVEVAEQTGLIHTIGAHVLEVACQEAATWPQTGDGLMLRINLSAAQLHREELVELIASVLERSGLAPNRLCIEVTESAAMLDVARSEASLHQLHDLGVELAIDDFGTGYSSLAYLKRFPFDVIKIDRSFVVDLEREAADVTFVHSIVSLANSLGLSVVAEGIESAGQAKALLALGCRRGQGHFLGQPGTSDELRTRIGHEAGDDLLEVSEPVDVTASGQG